MLKSISSLSGPNLQTYDRIFQHPSLHGVEWREVFALLEQLGHVAPEPNGHLKVTIRGTSRVFPAVHRGHNVEIGDLVELRRFLGEPDQAPPSAETESRWLVVIDHHQARVFATDHHGSIPHLVQPHPSSEHFRHAPHSKEFTRGLEKHDMETFFGPIAVAVKYADRILLMGNGKGSGCEMVQLSDWLDRHHPELARRVVATLVVDLHHLSEPELLAKAREYYAQLKSDTVSPNP